jgi:hypothetical protein
LILALNECLEFVLYNASFNLLKNRNKKRKGE